MHFSFGYPEQENHKVAKPTKLFSLNAKNNKYPLFQTAEEAITRIEIQDVFLSYSNFTLSKQTKTHAKKKKKNQHKKKV